MIVAKKVKRNQKIFTVKEYMEVMKEGDYVETNINSARVLSGSTRQGIVSLNPKCINESNSPDTKALGLLLNLKLGEEYSIAEPSFPYCYGVWWVGLNTDGYIKLLGNKKDTEKYSLNKENKISLGEGQRLIIEGDKIKIEGRYFGLIKPLEGEVTMAGCDSFIFLQNKKGSTTFSTQELKGYKSGIRVSFNSDYYFEFI